VFHLCKCFCISKPINTYFSSEVNTINMTTFLIDVQRFQLLYTQKTTQSCQSQTRVQKLLIIPKHFCVNSTNYKKLQMSQKTICHWCWTENGCLQFTLIYILPFILSYPMFHCRSKVIILTSSEVCTALKQHAWRTNSAISTEITSYNRISYRKWQCVLVYKHFCCSFFDY